MLYDIFVNLLASLIWVVLAWFGSRLYRKIKRKRIAKTGNTAFLRTRSDISKAEFQDAVSWHMIFIVMGIFGMCHNFLFILSSQMNSCVHHVLLSFYFISPSLSFPLLRLYDRLKKVITPYAISNPKKLPINDDKEYIFRLLSYAKSVLVLPIMP